MELALEDELDLGKQRLGWWVGELRKKWENRRKELVRRPVALKGRGWNQGVYGGHGIAIACLVFRGQGLN